MTSPRRKGIPENLFIYKDFETNLTKVKVPVTRLPSLGQTTNKCAEDLIRDRLLSFNVRDGVATKFDPDPNRRLHPTINQRTAYLQEKRKKENLKTQLQ